MIKAILLTIMLCITTHTQAAQCSRTCGKGNCSELSYFISQCGGCNKINASCRTSFCHNHPNLCENDVPLHGLSFNTQEITPEGKVLDVCLAPLFPEMTFNGFSNGDLKINNLNTLDIAFFAQTGGADEREKYARNLGIIKKLMANYLVFKNPKLKDTPIALKTIVDQELTLTYFKNINRLTLDDFHIIAQDLRTKIYHLKGIETQLRTQTYGNSKYPLSVSKLGCTGEQ